MISESHFVSSSHVRAFVFVSMAIMDVAPVGDIAAQTWEYTFFYGERPCDQNPLLDREIHQLHWYTCSRSQNQMFGYVWKSMNSLILEEVDDHQAPQHQVGVQPRSLKTFPTKFQRQMYTKSKYVLDGVELLELAMVWFC